ncbi:MAG: hypothetical protein P8O05_00310, partial [Flavobacteriales bacterium]|nr:hypothetical protein [Flavobacteriales bacterium]
WIDGGDDLSKIGCYAAGPPDQRLALQLALMMFAICELSMDSRCSDGRFNSPTGYFKNPHSG